MKLDWGKTSTCKHENKYGDYLMMGSCGTPYCSWEEFHCRDCGAYVSECGCGCENGMSGWPRSRHRTERIKRRGLRPGSMSDIIHANAQVAK